MTYTAKPLSCDPTKLKGLSEKLIVSHWENNYGGYHLARRASTGDNREASLRSPGAPLRGDRRGRQLRVAAPANPSWSREESSHDEMRSLWEGTGGRGAAVLQRRVPGHLHGEGAGRPAAITRPHDRQEAA